MQLGLRKLTALSEHRCGDARWSRLVIALDRVRDLDAILHILNALARQLLLHTVRAASERAMRNDQEEMGKETMKRIALRRRVRKNIA